MNHVCYKHESNTVRVESARLVTGGHPLVPVFNYKCEPVESAIKERIISNQVRVVHLQHFVKEDFDLSAGRDMLSGEKITEGIGTEARG